MKESRKFQGGPPRAAAVLGLTICMVFLFTVLGGAGMAQNAVSAAQGQYGKKVTICHKGKKTISVGKAAVPAHLRHGDTVGTCASAKAKKAKKLKAAKLKAAKAKAAKAKAAKTKAAKTKEPKAKAEKKATPEAAKGKAETGKPDKGEPDKGGSDKPNPGRGKGK